MTAVSATENGIFTRNSQLYPDLKAYSTNIYHTATIVYLSSISV